MAAQKKKHQQVLSWCDRRVVVCVFSWLTAEELLVVALVCQDWHAHARKREYWQRLTRRKMQAAFAPGCEAQTGSDEAQTWTDVLDEYHEWEEGNRWRLPRGKSLRCRSGINRGRPADRKDVDDETIFEPWIAFYFVKKVQRKIFISKDVYTQQIFMAQFERLRHELSNHGVDVDIKGRVYCYNCGEEGHSGEACTELPMEELEKVTSAPFKPRRFLGCWVGGRRWVYDPTRGVWIGGVYGWMGLEDDKQQHPAKSVEKDNNNNNNNNNNHNHNKSNSGHAVQQRQGMAQRSPQCTQRTRVHVLLRSKRTAALQDAIARVETLVARVREADKEQRMQNNQGISPESGASPGGRVRRFSYPRQAPWPLLPFVQPGAEVRHSWPVPNEEQQQQQLYLSPPIATLPPPPPYFIMYYPFPTQPQQQLNAQQQQQQPQPQQQQQPQSSLQQLPPPQQEEEQQRAGNQNLQPQKEEAKADLSSSPPPATPYPPPPPYNYRGTSPPQQPPGSNGEHRLLVVHHHPHSPRAPTAPPPQWLPSLSPPLPQYSPYPPPHYIAAPSLNWPSPAVHHTHHFPPQPSQLQPLPLVAEAPPSTRSGVH